MSFKEHKYTVVRNAISFELANFALNYFLLKRDAVAWMHQNNYISEFTPGFGTWKDKQVPNTYSCYGDFFMETLMMKVLPVMKEHTDLDLIPTYTYTRAYKKGDILKRHKDRFSCEISTTMNLGGDDWPIYLEPDPKKGGVKPGQGYVSDNTKGVRVDLKPGDMLVYSGCELEHWREKFKGKECVQVFLHYNNRKTLGAKDNMFDKRPHLGLPSWFKK